MSLIVYIFSVFFPCRRSSSALRVRSAGHALNLNKGCTKRQSLPNCQQNGRPGRKAGCKVLFCQKRRGDQAAEGGGFFEERQSDGTAAERHGKQLPQTRRPGFRGYKSRGPDRTAAEREAAQRRAINNPRQGIDNGRRPTNGGR